MRTPQSDASTAVTAAIENASGNETATATVSAVIDTEETKRTAIGRAGKTVRSAVEQCSPRKTVVSLFVRDIALPPLPRRHLGSEEGPVTMTYVSTRQ